MDHPVTIFVYAMLLIVLWVYGVIDAYKVSMRRAGFVVPMISSK
jgi:hypothetical protein